MSETLDNRSLDYRPPGLVEAARLPHRLPRASVSSGRLHRPEAFFFAKVVASSRL
jgi:hypothetical protein